MFTKEQINEELSKIQRTIPVSYLKNVIKKQKLSPTIKKVVLEASKDKTISEEKRKEYKLLLDSGELDKIEIVENGEVKTETPPEVDWKAKAEELEAKNRQLFARLKKQDPAEKKSKVNSQPEKEDSDWKNKIEFITTKGRNLDADDVDEVIAYAKGRGISYDEALNSDVIKNHLKVKQARAKIANATPPSSSKSTVINGKNWSQMNDQERANNFSKMMKRK